MISHNNFGFVIEWVMVVRDAFFRYLPSSAESISAGEVLIMSKLILRASTSDVCIAQL